VGPHDEEGLIPGATSLEYSISRSASVPTEVWTTVEGGGGGGVGGGSVVTGGTVSIGDEVGEEGALMSS